MSNKKNSIRTSVTQTEMQHWQGPLPPPESLAKYDEVIPGSAQEILSMAVREQEHRHELENKNAQRQYTVVIVSTISALIVVLALVFLVFYSIYKGSNNAYLAGIISAIAAVAGVFGIRKLLHFRKQ